MFYPEFFNETQSSDSNRGYFSENLTFSENSIDSKINNHEKYLWTSQTNQYSPIIHELPNPSRESCLAPAQRWIKYRGRVPISFPLQTIKPKVQLLHYAPSGQLPREVEVERRRRLYGKQKIQDMMKTAGVELWKLIPIDVMKNHLTQEENLDVFGVKCSKFPLHWFDDTDQDCMTPTDWINLGLLDGIRHPLPAEAFLPNRFLQESLPHELSSESMEFSFEDRSYESYGLASKDVAFVRNHLYQWTKVAVRDYDAENELWIVTDLITKVTYKIPRIQLMFIAENPEEFIYRVRKALLLRENCEKWMKLDLIVDSLILKGMPEINQTIVDKIYDLTISGLKMKNINEKWLEDLETETQLEYQRCLGKMEFVWNIRSNPVEYSFINLPDVEKILAKPRIVTGMEDFYGTRKYLGRTTIFCMQQIVRAFFEVVKKCHQISEMSLFTNTFTKHISLADFQSAQTYASIIVRQYLRGFWIENMSEQICLVLNELGKGAFDLNLISWDVFTVLKIQRFMNLVKHRMEYALRELIEKSTGVFCNILCVPCQKLLGVSSDYVWGIDLTKSPFEPPGNHVFTLILQMNEDGVFYSTNPDDFEQTLIELFDDAIRQTHYVRRIEPFIMKNLVFSDDLMLSSVGLNDKMVSDRRNLIKLCYEKAIIPLKAYAKKFEKFLDLYKMDVKSYVQNLKESDKKSQEIKEEISFQKKMKENFQVTLPGSILIGPFLINVEPIKELFLTKQQDLVNQLLEMFEEQLNERSLAIIDEYKIIMKHLCEKPASIEHIHDIKIWMETIPEAVLKQEELMRTILFDYELLDHFWYSLNNENFSIKWEAVSWPFKISKQIISTREMHEEDTEKFHKIHFSDQINFEERIEGINVQVTGFSTNFEYSKATEFSIEIKKIWKNIIDSQTYGELLNKRQVLFELPEINLNNIKTLMISFSPYKSLWVTAADFLKWEDAWLGNPLTNIDPELIRKSIKEYKTTIEECIKIFNEIKQIQEVAERVLTDIEIFEPCVDVIEFLKSSIWNINQSQELCKRSEMEFKYSSAINFGYLKAKGIMSHVNLVKEIYEKGIRDKEKNEAEAAEAARILKMEEEALNERHGRRQRRSDLFI